MYSLNVIKWQSRRETLFGDILKQYMINCGKTFIENM